jgi:hypothetical protein
LERGVAKKMAAVPSITGDVSIEEVTINRKGGSLSAILKKSIRGSLESSVQTFGARIDFEPGVSCLLMAPGSIASEDREGHARRISVQRVSLNRFIIDLTSEEEKETVDPMTKATLKILEDKLKKGDLTILTQEELDQNLADLQEKAKKSLSKLKRISVKPSP